MQNLEKPKIKSHRKELSLKKLTLEVTDGKDISATFAGSGNDLGRVDFGESLLGQNIAEQTTYASLQAKNGLICWRSQVEYAVI